MAKAVGIGGAFMKAKDPEKLARWYLKALGIADEFGSSNVGGFGASFFPQQLPESAYLRFSVEGSDSIHFPGAFMLNFIVEDINGLLSQIEHLGGNVLRKGFNLEGVGEFAWIEDPEGNRVELWEPEKGA